MSNDSYVFTNDPAGGVAVAHHVALAETANERQLQRIAAALGRPLTGLKVWDVGTGAGYMAQALDQRVGPKGYTLATDLDLDLFVNRGNVHALVHDIRRDPLPGSGFDLIVVSHVSNHLPHRLALVARLADALAPGGVLLFEDFRAGEPEEVWRMVLSSSMPGARKVWAKVQRTFLKVLEGHGHDRNWPFNTFSAMVDAGLIGVDTGAEQFTWRGAGSGCQLLRSGYMQVVEELRELGITAEELAMALEFLNDVGTALLGYLSHWTIGRKPYPMPDDG
jgi:SAM-dependent methyltransferase